MPAVQDGASMHVDFSGSFFELFDLPASFDVDNDKLVVVYRQLQQQLHPDKYVSRPDAERRWSMQAASFVNEGYQTLKGDLLRAIYLLQINGIDMDEESDTQMDPMFLMEQMELREALEIAEAAADPFAALTSIRKQLRSAVSDQSNSFSAAAISGDWGKGRAIARQWQFLDKLLKETKNIEERLDA